MKRLRADDESGSPPVIPPPASVDVAEPDRRPVLYRADGTPLIRRPIGFRTIPRTR